MSIIHVSISWLKAAGSILAAFLIFFFSELQAAEEKAALEASVLPGQLSIEIGGSVPETGLFATFTSPSVPMPERAFGISTNQFQPDALLFDINDIKITDTDGDGLGFRVTAEPENLIHEDYNGQGGARRRRSTLTVGSIDGFMNPSDSANSIIVDPNTLVYQSGAGVVLMVDYAIHYNIPRRAIVGDYEGKVAFSVVAE